MRLLNRSVGRLSRHRRGRVAGLVVLLVGLLLTGGLYASFAPAQAGKADSNEDLIKQGRELFLVSCSFCHGQNGEGLLTKDGDNFGPPLTDVGAAAVHFQVGTGRMPLQQPGAQAPRKKPVFDEEETAALAAFVASLGTGPAIPDVTDYDID
ncbi:MAG TPA: cytochrome c, partial [Nocardioides sp.]|nr:cytochrome c [Nocardioides sp.]